MLPDDDAPKMKEIYAYLGYAMFLSQILEAGLAQAAIVLVEFQNNRDAIKAISEEGAHEKWVALVGSFEEKHKKKSVDQLIKILSKNESISSDVKACLDDARRDRNFVAHNFFKEYLAKLYHEERQDEAIAYLKKICLVIENALDQLRPVLFEKLAAYGYDEEFVMEQCMQIVAEAK